ncbi:DotU family type IV/VI secretion system protein [Salmonella enterica]|nr:DotU family type IV/VI secretion system protein [Salmonella enterica]EEJ9029336.1 DotU family type IV/VI secretion system protein [Salmonella enterica subsp. enterica]
MNELLECYLPIFKLINKAVFDPDCYVNYSLFHSDCVSQLEHAINKANKLDICIEERKAALFAVVAWVDEQILCSSFSWKFHWQGDLLQKNYLETTTAGEDFFIQLNKLAVNHRQSRRVFLFCLQNGFHGQFSMPEDQMALSNLIITQREICLSGAWNYWPNEEVITPFFKSKSPKMPHKRYTLIGITILLLLYTITYFYLNTLS